MIDTEITLPSGIEYVDTEENVRVAKIIASKILSDYSLIIKMMHMRNVACNKLQSQINILHQDIGT